MICPYSPMKKVVQPFKDTNGHNTGIVTTVYYPTNCFGNRCPFYSDGNGDYTEGTCIKAAKEMEE